MPYRLWSFYINFHVYKWLRFICHLILLLEQIQNFLFARYYFRAGYISILRVGFYYQKSSSVYLDGCK